MNVPGSAHCQHEYLYVCFFFCCLSAQLESLWRQSQNVAFGARLVKVITKFFFMFEENWDHRMSWLTITETINGIKSWVAGRVTPFYQWICCCISSASCTFPSPVVILPSSQVMWLFILHKLEQWPNLFFWYVCLLCKMKILTLVYPFTMP